MSRPNRNLAISLAALAFAMSLVALSAKGLENLREIRKTAPSRGLFDHVRLDLPLSAISLGHGSAIASVVYVSGLLELADEILGGGESSRLARLIRTTALLDPDWKEPYTLALIIEDSLGRPRREAIELLSQAVVSHPDAWRFRSYLAMSILRYPELGIQARIDSSAKVMEILEGSTDSTIPDHIRFLGRALRMGENSALVDLMLGSYIEKSPVSRNRFRGELAELLERRSGLPADFVRDFLSGLDALPPERRGAFARLEVLTSRDGASFVELYRSMTAAP